ncbi:MAG: HAD-IA family hydrolase [Acidaminobacter sp.]|uniref:HAD family hydrolase n=1 Tax=Acidaminobacter sp. TaxID=1872102 RepID=UPI00137E5617|nr:HAD-IA family hydrolase [Acidaminobacter sp.]MZQ97533.1 HAD-IA family hydrolase [Acidaminobacter sp.]
MIKAVIFDLDGTLIDTNDLILDTFQHVIKECLGRVPTVDELHQVYGKTLDEQMGFFSMERSQELVASYKAYYRTHMDERTHLFEGVKSLLDKLFTNGIQMAAVTNKGSRGVQHAFDKFDLGKYFVAAITADDVVKGKPDPEGILAALNHLGVTAEEALFVGDSHSDILAAKNASVKSVLVGWTFFHEDHYATFEADFVIEKPMDLIRLV